MSETAVIDQPLDLKSESAEKPPKLIEEAKSKVTKFVSSVFNGNVPIALQQRLELLGNPNLVIIGDKAVDDELTKNKVYTNYNTESTVGFYHSKTDKIYLRDGVTEKTAVHEFLHFLSSAKDDEGSISGIANYKLDNISDLLDAVLSSTEPSKYDPVNKKPNEAITEILTQLIEAGINIDDPEAFYKLYGKIKTKQESADLQSADSYQDYILNTFEFMYKNLDTVSIVKDLSQYYLLGDRLGFEDMLKSRAGFSNIVFSKIGKKDIVKEFYDESKKEAIRDLESLKELIAHTNDRFQKDPRFSKDLKELMNFLHSSFQNPEEVEVDIVHPENNNMASSKNEVDYITVKPGIYRDGQKSGPTRIKIDSRFLNLYSAVIDPPEGYTMPFQYLCQMEGYLLWNAILLKQIEGQGIKRNLEKKVYLNKEGNSIDIDDLRSRPFGNPDFRNFLFSLSISEMAKVIGTFGILNMDADDKESAALIEKLAMRSNGLNDLSVLDLREEGSEERISKELDQKGVGFNETLITRDGYIYIPNMDLSQVEKLHS